MPASHCPSSSTLQRKREVLSAQQEGEAAPGSCSTSCSPASAGVRCLARLSASMTEEIVQTLHLFLMVGAQAQPCFPRIYQSLHLLVCCTHVASLTTHPLSDKRGQWSGADTPSVLGQTLKWCSSAQPFGSSLTSDTALTYTS